MSKIGIWKWAMLLVMVFISMDRGSTIISYYLTSFEFGTDPERLAEVEYLTNSGLWGLVVFFGIFCILHFFDKKYGHLYPE